MTTRISLPQNVFGNPKYQGKHVLIDDKTHKVLTYGSWNKVSKAFDLLLQKTKKSPILTFVPKGDILIF